MSVFTVTEQEKTRWQLKGAKALAELLNNAFHEKLPAIDWRLATGSALIGEIQHPGVTPAQKREQFDAWTLYLGGTAEPEVTTAGGRTTLLTKIKRHPAYDVDITVYTEFYADEQG
ncbi:hypothetical protein [Kitasatospora aureofaciens]|uniref:hypothetical protein n=1 Tax=Kitasatospora aureofaciens TaxID=1894 RepID=UPI0037C8B9EB